MEINLKNKNLEVCLSVYEEFRIIRETTYRKRTQIVKKIQKDTEDLQRFVMSHEKGIQNEEAKKGGRKKQFC